MNVLAIDRFRDREMGRAWGYRVIAYTFLLAIASAIFAPAFYANTGAYSVFLSCIWLPQVAKACWRPTIFAPSPMYPALQSLYLLYLPFKLLAPNEG